MRRGMAACWGEATIYIDRNFCEAKLRSHYLIIDRYFLNVPICLIDIYIILSISITVI
jgi:hypothetical protein